MQEEKNKGEGFHHEEVVEQEDLPLMQAQLLELVGVRHFKQTAVTHQPAMGQRQHLDRKEHGWQPFRARYGLDGWFVFPLTKSHGRYQDEIIISVHSAYRNEGTSRKISCF